MDGFSPQTLLSAVSSEIVVDLLKKLSQRCFQKKWLHGTHRSGLCLSNIRIRVLRLEKPMHATFHEK